MIYKFGIISATQQSDSVLHIHTSILRFFFLHFYKLWLILKYGTDNFSIELIEECPDEAADVVESYWIYKLDTINNGYNSCFSYGKNSFSAKSVPSEKYLKQLNKTKFPLKAID